MPEGAFHQPTKARSTALVVVIAMHGAAIAALALTKMEVISAPNFGPTEIFEVFTPPPPPPPPVERVEPEVRTPQARSVIEAPVPIVDREPPPIDFETTPVLPPAPPPTLPPAAETVLPPPPPPPPARKSQAARARANLGSYVSNDDYPAAALRRGDTGTTHFRLTVGPNGRVSDCAIVKSSGSSTLDSATCRLMRSRARFEPAKNSDGKPISDTVSSAIRWVLPS